MAPPRVQDVRHTALKIVTTGHRQRDAGQSLPPGRVCDAQQRIGVICGVNAALQDEVVARALALQAIAAGRGPT